MKGTLSTSLLLIAFGIALIAGLLYYRRQHRTTRDRRATYIRTYSFSAALRSKLALKYPALDSEQLDQVFRALRQYFLLCLNAGRGRVIGMPSKVVDDAWHEFILNSREYMRFCEAAFGRYLHHTPDSAMKTGMDHALVNTLNTYHSSSAGQVGWATLAGIPLLFAIDRAFAIPGGYAYGPEEMAKLEKKRSQGSDGGGSCGGDASFFGGDSGHAGGDAGSGTSCGGTSGCSSGGCGGGGCGSE